MYAVSKGIRHANRTLSTFLVRADTLNDHSMAASWENEPSRNLHVYTGLSSPQSFRLLRLRDAAFLEDPIECSIETYELDEEGRPAYTALSYTWGSSSRDDIIALASGSVVKGTPTLVQALRYMRQLQQTRDDMNGVWWIDMVCIDQDNISERGQQVALMRDIFQAAVMTVVWLGPSSGGSDTLMDYLDGNVAHSRRAFRSWTSSAEGKAAIRGFQDRPYWKRAWIIQEVCVSRDVLLVFGRKTAPWKALDASHKWLRTYPQAHSVPDLRVLRSRFQSTDLRLGFLVYRAAAAQCTNGRDKVFSLLGLVTSGRGVKMVPDYAMSPCAVFAGAIRAVQADVEQSNSPVEPSRGRWRRADSFRKRYVQIVDEVQSHSHDPLDDNDDRRLDCDGVSCGMWELCWKFSGIALHLD